MFTATVRAMAAHKLRLALTTASIALGTAFLAGTLILTSTMNLAFTQLFGSVSSGTDAVVRTETAYDQAAGVGLSRAPIGADVLETVRSVEGVAAAEGYVSGYALLTDTQGRAVLPEGGAPTMGYSLPADEGLRGDVELLDGVAPHGPGEVAIDATSAAEHDIPIGSTIDVLFRGPTREFTVVGTVGFAGEHDLGGTTSAYFDTATAQRALGFHGQYESINVRGEEGVSDAELTKRLNEVAPPGTEAVTGAAVAEESAHAVSENLSVVTILFTAFAAVALFVGAFIIWNTFTMTVTQRSREIALLRAVGATRGQVMRGLVTEAFLLGGIGSAVGVGLGIGVAAGLRALMDTLGFSLPSTSLQIELSTVVISLLVGTVVTVASALVPARRATRVRPIEALRAATPGARPASIRRLIVGTAVLALGAAGVLSGLYGDGGMAVFGLGALAGLLGVITMLPALSRPLARLIGAPLRLRGLPGELAQQNAMRNPHRTAATAAALMIGLTLVVSMGVFASSLKASFGDILAGKTEADLYLVTSSTQAAGFSPEVIKAVATVEGVETVSPTGWGQARFAGSDSSYSAVDPATAEEAMDLGVTEGSVADLGRDGIVVSEAAADAHGWVLGDSVTAEFPSTGRHELEVVGVFEAQGWIADEYMISLEAEKAFAGPQLTTMALLLLDDGADRGTVKDRIDDVLASHPDARVLDQEEYEDVASGFIDQLLVFVTVMLMLAVAIALLGIVNTLALSVFERTRELGLLRAVGMTRGQVRSLVRWESAIIALMGAVAGTALGVALGVALSQALKDEGIDAVSIPLGQIAFYLVLAAVAGILAAVGPARSAARVDVLKAVVTD